MSKKITGLLMLTSFVAGALSYRVTTPPSGKMAAPVRKMSSITNETSVSPNAQEIVNEMGKMNSPQEITAFINKHTKIIDDNIKAKSLDQLPKDYRLMLSALYPLKNMQGFAHRTYGFVNMSNKEKKSVGVDYNMNTVQTIMDSKFQAALSLINTYSPQFGTAVFDWMSSPVEGLSYFKKVEDVQNFVISTVYKDIQTSLSILHSIGQVALDAPIVLDTASLTGIKNALPDERRFLNVYAHEINLMKSIFHHASHDLIIYAQYDRNDFVNFEFNLKRKMVFNPFKFFWRPWFTDEHGSERI